MAAMKRPRRVALSSNSTMNPAESFERQIAVHQHTARRLPLKTRTAMIEEVPSSRKTTPRTI
jgi:hypothetical protein